MKVAEGKENKKQKPNKQQKKSRRKKMGKLKKKKISTRRGFGSCFLHNKTHSIIGILQKPTEKL